MRSVSPAPNKPVAGMTLRDHQSSVAERVSLTFECHGTTVSVRADEHAVLKLVRERLPPGAQLLQTGQPDVSYEVRPAPDESASGRCQVVAVRCAGDGEWSELARAPDAMTAALLAADDVEFRVALHAPSKLFVHAAAVAWQGRVIVVPGRTYTGKSTLAAALVRAGAAYYSDEFTVIDEAGLVHVFARPLQLRSHEGGRGRCVTARSIGGAEGVEPLPLGLVVSAPYCAGAHWSPRVMSPGETALALLDNAIVARIRPAHAMKRIARALERGACGLQGMRGEADDAAPLLLDRVTSTRTASSTR
jgi:hypothetical protein